VSRLKLLHEVLALEEKISEIERIAETEEYRELEETLDAVARLMADVDMLDTLVRRSMREEAESRVEHARGAIDDYFCKIVRNPGIQTLGVEIEEDRRTGGNSYRFCDSSGQDLSPILSQGDLNGLALSMFLGLVEAYSHPVGFVLMDDPSQSLGTEQKKRLVEVLDEVCRGGRCIVVATMDTELQGFLDTSLTRAKTTYQISGWHPESGPRISKLA